jgi:hypothetical protein
MNRDLIVLTHVPRELPSVTVNGASISYRSVYRAVVDGKLPMVESNNGRWYVDRENLPALALALGLPVAAVPQKRQWRHTDLPAAFAPTAPAVAAKLGVVPVAKDEIESPSPPCAPAAAPVEMTSPTRRGRSAVTPEKAGPKPAPGKSARSNRRRAA